MSELCIILLIYSQLIPLLFSSYNINHIPTLIYSYQFYLEQLDEPILARLAKPVM